MKRLNIKQIDEIVEVITSGGIVALPTDTIYGFSCLATNNEAIKRLCSLKNRDDGKQFILLVSSKFNLNNLLDMSDGGDNLKLMFKTVKRKDKLDLTKENLTEENKKEKNIETKN
mgnify:CR=1 FL=1